MALHSLYCADVPIRNGPNGLLTHSGLIGQLSFWLALTIVLIISHDFSHQKVAQVSATRFLIMCISDV